MEKIFDRRMLLKAAAAATAGVVSTPTFASAADRKTRVARYVFRGHFTDPSTPDWVYLPFRVPKRTSRIHVEYDYTPTTGGPITTNVVDIGIFDASGHGVGNAAGFRGWSVAHDGSSRSAAATRPPGTSPGRSRLAPG